MSQPTTVSAESEQRLLAAIVFTDVAGFSRRVQVEEAMTLKLLERDFVAMRAFAAMHSGRVIKSTGDGLLLFFTSAVQAVEWSLKTQRHFADQAAELPPQDVLRHRVGVHLGDVVLAGGDVMGDGVNIAARVQAEAPAGGICISQVVYGVVKNKMKLDVTKLELRRLKNISEPVQIYRVLLEPPLQRAGPSLATASPVSVADEVPATSWKKWALIGVVLLAVGGGVGFWLMQAHREYQRELAGSQGVRDALGAAMRAGANDAAEPSTPPNAPSSAAPANPVAATNVTATPAAAGYDFAKLAAARSDAATLTAEEGKIREAAQAAIAPLDPWVVKTLERFTALSPLAVQPLGAAFGGSLVYMDEKHQLWFREGGASMRRNWQELAADKRGGIIVALISATPVSPQIDRAAGAYAYLNRLPEMAGRLIYERSRR